MSFKREVEYLLRYHLWTRQMVIGQGTSMEIAFQEFPYFINELIYTNLHRPAIIELHKQHTYFRMQYDILQSEYKSKADTFSMRDDWKIECSFEFVVQYLFDLLVETDREPELQEMLKRRYRRYLLPGTIDQTACFK